MWMGTTESPFTKTKQIFSKNYTVLVDLKKPGFWNSEGGWGLLTMHRNKVRMVGKHH